MNLAEVLQILQEVNKLLAVLHDMGLKVSGTVDVPTLIAALGAQKS